MSTPQPSDPQQPRESSVIREPATVEACRRDYVAGADICRRLGWKDPA